jgi:radical SAM superfamily enzyme YgiQ (UPF0313 family)
MKVFVAATNRERSPYAVAPLGVLTVVAAARAAGHQVDFLDLNMERSPHLALKKALTGGDYQAVAFGIRNLDNCWAFAPRSYNEEVRGFAEVVRQCFEGPFILGGTGFSVSPQGWMRRLQADCGVIGEGEKAFVEVLGRLETRQSLEGLDGVITLAKAQSGEEPLPAKAIEKLDGMPVAAHELCGYKQYMRRGGYVGVQTKRGCPFKCTYCVYPQLEGRRYRLRPPEAVVEEVESVLVRSKVRHFFFVDSVFNDPRAHALQICRLLAKKRLPIQWNAFCNPVGFDAELAQAMAEAGCVGAEFGLDAAIPKMLAAMGKPFGQEEIRTALQATYDAKIPLLVSMLFGGPGQTWADVAEEQRFLNSCATANSVFAAYGLRIYEGTRIAKVAISEGVLPADQELFTPAYYLAPELQDRTVERLDDIARRRPEWSSPADWRKPIMTWAQKVTVFLDVRPQWKHISGYGRHMRKQIPVDAPLLK